MIDVENVARALHEAGFIWWEGMDSHAPFEECYCADARREDAQYFITLLTKPQSYAERDL